MAIPVFPDQNLASFIQSFTEQLDEDFQSPTISKFQDYMPRCRAGLQAMEEVLLSATEYGAYLISFPMLELNSGQEFGAQADRFHEGAVSFWGR